MGVLSKLGLRAQGFICWEPVGNMPLCSSEGILEKFFPFFCDSIAANHFAKEKWSQSLGKVACGSDKLK